MKNVKLSVEGNDLVIRIRLDEEHGESSSGKSVIIATSEGNQDVAGAAGVKFGLNVFRPLKK